MYNEYELKEKKREETKKYRRMKEEILKYTLKVRNI
jgi:hypothetical protein